tara:strand:+ start:18284 stop:18892 length:609 start_codon:yes stop_codon:yes gene_type:complete
MSLVGVVSKEIAGRFRLLQEGFRPLQNVTDLISTLEYFMFFVQREQAEEQPSWKQVIPYVVLAKGDQVYVTERLDGEPRLIGKLSVGLGGHVEALDAEEHIKGCVDRCMQRELTEEANITTSSTPKPIGIVYNPNSDVSLVHLGIVYLYELGVNDTVSIKETDKLKGFFAKPAEVDLQSAEGWSVPILKFLMHQEENGEKKI